MRIKTVVKRKKAKKRSKLVPRYEIRSDVEKIARDEFFGEERNAYKSKSVVHKKKRNRPAVIDSSQISGKSGLTICNILKILFSFPSKCVHVFFLVD